MAAVPGDPSGTKDQMERQLLKACSNGDLEILKTMMIHGDPNILMSVTPDGNNCLHLAAMLGYHEFAQEIWSQEPFLFLSTNKDGETPLILALAAANDTLASKMITAATTHLQPNSVSGMEGGKPLKFDIRGDNVLHHAMRNGFEGLAAELLDIEERLSEQINKCAESPMHMAARRGYSKVVEKLINIPTAASSGPVGFTALHAAVDAGHADIVKQLLKGLPKLADHKATTSGITPLGGAVLSENLEIVKILLEHDPNLAYIRKNIGFNPFMEAASKGFVQIAEEIFRVSPDSAYATSTKGGNALHIAIAHEQRDFVDYILRIPKLHRLIHQADEKGNMPLHTAARSCNPKLLQPLLKYKRQDNTAFNTSNANAVDIVTGKTGLFKTLKWNESYTLVSNLIPAAWRKSAINETKKEIRKQAIQEIKSLTERYNTNTSLVAALLATITFAAAFTLPGGFSSDTSDAGQPIFGMEAVFQVFLISDTIAMCSALAVAFLCILATWEDLDFLLNYRKTTRALMWCAYGTTAVAFGTGLFTVIAPKKLWLAILILALSSILPFVSKIIGDWPLLMLRCRLGRQFKNDLVPNI